MPKLLKTIENGSYDENKARLWNEKRRQNLEKARKARWALNKASKQTVSVPEEFQEIRERVMERLSSGDISGALRIGAPAVLSKMFDLAVSSVDTKVSRDCARDWAYMAGWKPVERSISIEARVNSMGEKELDALIASELARLPQARRKWFIEAMSEKEGASEKQKGDPHERKNKT